MSRPTCGRLLRILCVRFSCPKRGFSRSCHYCCSAFRTMPLSSLHRFSDNQHESPPSFGDENIALVILLTPRLCSLLTSADQKMSRKRQQTFQFRRELGHDFVQSMHERGGERRILGGGSKEASHTGSHKCLSIRYKASKYLFKQGLNLLLVLNRLQGVAPACSFWPW